MDKNKVLESIKNLKETSEKRNFKQTYDLIITLKDLDFKKQEERVSTFVTLPYGKGKKIKVCALVGKELLTQAKSIFDKVIFVEDFPKWTNKKEISKLAKDMDFFIAQANIMTDVAKTFGRVLGPLAKMPNPKAGCVVPPTVNLKILYEKLQKTLKVEPKNELSIKIPVGLEEMEDEKVAENVASFYNSIIHMLPKEEANIKNILLKFTMSKPVKIK